MVQPGEFCPLPNELMIILLFDLMYGVAEQKERLNFKTHSSSWVILPRSSGKRIRGGAAAVKDPKRESL